MADQEKLARYAEKFARELDRCIEFWTKNSHDEEYGGFFTCLTRDGKVYDDNKYGWLQGRQIWTYAKLYNDVDRFRRADMLSAAEKAASFLMKNAKNRGTGKCYFSYTRDGRPIKNQRTIFTETFYIMGMSELAKATGKDVYKKEAIEMMDKVVYWARVDDTDLGREKTDGAPPINNNAVDMMLLCCIQQLENMDDTLAAKYEETKEWAVKWLLKHEQRDGTRILENISYPDGKELPGSNGRIMNPGHAIEIGWFLLRHCNEVKDNELTKRVIDKFILNPFQYGWDKQHGGLFNFLDADGLPPMKIEWNMKFWWPHQEALIGLLHAYRETRNPQIFAEFEKVMEYCWKYFVDPGHGEWYGYLDRQNQITSDIKGNDFKGCFHTPRCLMMCEKMLKELIDSV